MESEEKTGRRISRYFIGNWPTWMQYIPAACFLLLGVYFVLMLPYYPRQRDLWPSLAGTVAACGILSLFYQRPSAEKSLWPYGIFLTGTIGFFSINIIAVLLSGDIAEIGTTHVLWMHIPGVLIAIGAGLGLRNSQYHSGFLAVVLIVLGIWYSYEALSLTWTAPYRESMLVLNRGYHTVLAMELLFVFSIFLAFAVLTDTRRYGLCSLLMAVVVGWLLLQTKARSALMVMVFITIPATAMVQTRWGTFRKRLLVFLILLLVLAPVACALWFAQASIDRRSMVNVRGRFQAWIITAQIALKRPWTEALVGNGGFDRTFDATAEHYGIDPYSHGGEELWHAHNVLMQTFLETGILGSLALVLIWIAAAYRSLLAWISRSSTVAGVMFVALLSMAFMGQMDYSLHGTTGIQGQLSWFIVGLAFASGD